MLCLESSGKAHGIMSSRVRLVSPQLTPPATAVLETDWTKCVLCQHDKNEKLLCPANSKKQGSVGAGM